MHVHFGLTLNQSFPYTQIRLIECPWHSTLCSLATARLAAAWNDERVVARDERC